MKDAEERGLPYLLKLRQSKNVKRLIEEAFERDDWVPAGQRWEGVEDELRLPGWSWPPCRRLGRMRGILRVSVAKRHDAGGRSGFRAVAICLYRDTRPGENK